MWVGIMFEVFCFVLFVQISNKYWSILLLETDINIDPLMSNFDVQLKQEMVIAITVINSNL